MLASWSVDSTCHIRHNREVQRWIAGTFVASLYRSIVVIRSRILWRNRTSNFIGMKRKDIYIVAKCSILQSLWKSKKKISLKLWKGHLHKFKAKNNSLWFRLFVLICLCIPLQFVCRSIRQTICLSDFIKFIWVFNILFKRGTASYCYQSQRLTTWVYSTLSRRSCDSRLPLSGDSIYFPYCSSGKSFCFWATCPIKDLRTVNCTICSKLIYNRCRKMLIRHELNCEDATPICLRNTCWVAAANHSGCCI